jgi:hypothetical protein
MDKEKIAEEVAKIVGDYCSKEIVIGGFSFSHHSKEVEETLVRVNLRNIGDLATDEEVREYMAVLKRSKGVEAS